MRVSSHYSQVRGSSPRRRKLWVRRIWPILSRHRTRSWKHSLCRALSHSQRKGFITCNLLFTWLFQSSCRYFLTEVFRMTLWSATGISFISTVLKEDVPAARTDCSFPEIPLWLSTQQNTSSKSLLFAAWTLWRTCVTKGFYVLFMNVRALSALSESV